MFTEIEWVVCDCLTPMGRDLKDALDRRGSLLPTAQQFPIEAMREFPVAEDELCYRTRRHSD